MLLLFFRSKPIVVFFTFLFVFGASVKVLPVNTAKVTLLVSAFIFFLMCVGPLLAGRLKFFDWPIICAFLIPLILMCYALMLPTIMQTSDYSLAYNLGVLTFENVLGAYFLFRVFLVKKTDSELLDILIWIGLIQSLIILGMLVSGTFKDIVFEWFGNDAILAMSDRYGGVRGFGIAGSVTYDLSVLISICMVLSAYQICHTNGSQHFYLIAWLLGFIAVMVSGRTGFLGVFISILVVLCSLHKRQAWIGSSKLIFFAALSVSCGIFLLNRLYPEVWLLVTDFLLPYAFEMFFSAADGDGFNTNSSDVLKEMYFPISEATFWLGDARWKGDGGVGYYMHTDAGYMRHILFYGVPGSLTLYSFYVYVFVLMYIFDKSGWRNFVFFLACYFFIVHLKGDFMGGSSMNTKFIMILFCFIVWNRNSHFCNSVDREK